MQKKEYEKIEACDTKIELQSEALFLKSVMKPVEDKVEMAKVKAGKLPKMCDNSFYGN